MNKTKFKELLYIIFGSALVALVVATIHSKTQFKNSIRKNFNIIISYLYQKLIKLELLILSFFLKKFSIRICIKKYLIFLKM